MGVWRGRCGYLKGIDSFLISERSVVLDISDVVAVIE